MVREIIIETRRHAVSQQERERREKSAPFVPVDKRMIANQEKAICRSLWTIP